MSGDSQRKVAAIIGGGVIGGGWAARFSIHHRHFIVELKE